MQKDVYGLVKPLQFQGNGEDLLSIESIQTTQPFIRHENLLQQQQQQQPSDEVNENKIRSVCCSGHLTGQTTVWFQSFASRAYFI